MQTALQQLRNTSIRAAECYRVYDCIDKVRIYCIYVCMNAYMYVFVSICMYERVYISSRIMNDCMYLCINPICKNLT